MIIENLPKMGSPKLFTPSERINENEFATKELYELIKNMEDTMQAKQGAGIAAPQIGINKRVIMFGFEKNPRYPHAPAVPFTVLVNPQIKILDQSMEEDWEGCLSVPGLRGKVPRHKKIQYSGFDPEGNNIERIAEDFHARVVQHEVDHVDGILFPMRIKDMKNFGFEAALRERIKKDRACYKLE